MTDTNQTFSGRVGVLKHLLNGSKRFFAAGIALGWIMSLFSMISPRVITYTVDTVLGQEPPDLPGPVLAWVNGLGGTAFFREHLYYIALVVVAVELAAMACRWGFRMMNARGQERFLRRTRRLLYHHIIHLPLDWHNHNHTGDIIQRCTSDVESVRAFLADQLVTLIRVAVLLVLSLYFMITLSPALSLIPAAFIPVIILFSVFFHRRIEKNFKAVDEKEGELSAVAQENLTGVRVVRAFGREKYERERFESTNDVYTGLWDKVMRLLASFWATGDAISCLQRLLILSVGCALCVHDRLTVGRFIAFISYSAMLEWPVRSLGRVISGMSRAGVSIDRIRYILNSPQEDHAVDGSGEPLSGDIVFDHVSFAYGDGEAALKDVSFTAREGRVTGILGTTGSGKSTLMYLLCRLYDPTEGRVLIGGRDLKNEDRFLVRRSVGIVQQEPFLFSRTIADNIAMGTEKTDMAEIRDAARVAMLDETAMRFAKGYDTEVGERGVSLSGGQKQRTAIAQALMLKRPILLLDDSLSAVDTRTDMEIRRAMDQMEQKTTRIIISHRITTLMSADHIVVMDRGRVVEEGTHEELSKKGGMYQRIYRMQVLAGASGYSKDGSQK